MFRALWQRTRVGGSERGTALMAAIAVAIIGMALATVVVSNAISSAASSGRDRARTTDVHSAEGALDVVFSQLEDGTPCAWPTAGSFDALTTPTKSSVKATVAYFDKDNNALTCAGGVVTGTPTVAVVTATSQATGSATTTARTKRTMQAKVNLTPNMIPGRGAAIFAANNIMTTNSFTLETSLPDTPVDVWVDTGNVDCNSNVKIDGNLIVVNGTTSISNGCRVTQNLWSKKKLTVNAAQSAGLTTVGQDTYVSADATIAGGSKYGRDLIVAGAVSTWAGGPIVGGQYKTGVGTGAIPQYVPTGLPEVNYKPADWTGFANSGDRAAAYKSWVNTAATTQNHSTNWNNTTNEQCDIAGESWRLNGPLIGPSVPTVYDTRFCSTTKFEGNTTIKLNADMVIYANDFYATGNFQVLSGDGQPHKFWVIVPDPDTTPNGVAECKTVGSNKAGNIKFDSGALAIAPITFFGYTPCTLETNNTTTFYGQLYGGSVILRNAMTMRYVPIGIPGVSFPNTNPTASSGYRVDVVYKREIKNP